MAGSNGEDRMALTRPFLQCTKTNARTNVGNISSCLVQIVKVAKKHEVIFYPITIKQNLCAAMPAWFHPDLSAIKNIRLQ